MFEELLKLACVSVEFSIDNQMYQQIGGISIGSPLGPIISTIFVGFYEYKLYPNNHFCTINAT